MTEAVRHITVSIQQAAGEPQLVDFPVLDDIIMAGDDWLPGVIAPIGNHSLALDAIAYGINEGPCAGDRIEDCDYFGSPGLVTWRIVTPPSEVVSMMPTMDDAYAMAWRDSDWVAVPFCDTGSSKPAP